MRKLFIILALLSSCHEKREMSFEELKTASWKNLSKGIDYISLEQTGSRLLDSLKFIVKGYHSPKMTIPASTDEIQSSLDTILAMELNKKLRSSKKGYLRIDLFEMASPSELSLHIDLTSNYDTLRLPHDIDLIKKTPYVQSAIYISKERAKQIFLEDGNQSWDNILDENPLPASIEVKIDAGKYNNEWLDSFKKNIESSMLYVASVRYPEIKTEMIKGNTFYIIYERY